MLNLINNYLSKKGSYQKKFFSSLSSKSFYKKLVWISIIIFSILILTIIFFLVIFSNEYVEVTGRVVPVKYQEVSPKIKGIIKKVYFKNGDKIDTRSLLLEIDSSELRNQLNSIEIRIEKLKDDILFSEDSLKILKKKQKSQIQLLKNSAKEKELQKELKVISDVNFNNFQNEKKIKLLDIEYDMLKLEHDLKSKKSELDLLETERKNILIKIDKCKVYSSINGIIIADKEVIIEGKEFEPEDVLQYVYSTDKIIAELTIPEKYIPKIEIDQNVKLFMTALPYYKYKVFKGKLIEFKKDTDKGRKYYIGKVIIEDPYFNDKRFDHSITKKIAFGFTFRARIYTGRKNILKSLLNYE